MAVEEAFIGVSLLEISLYLSLEGSFVVGK